MVGFIWMSHPVLPELMADATFIVGLGFLLMFVVRLCQWGVMLYRWLTSWDGKAEQGELFEIEISDWVPEEGAAKRSRTDRVPYEQWIADGLITATPGNVVDQGFIREDINGLATTSGRWRKLIAAVLVAVALSGTAVALEAYPLSCETMPPWTIEYFFYCYLAN